ncbi:hypothetical protein [Aliarcobacter butzleri]|uniref:hypothetical protein n=1 Tax=Aliarcobacter butzleri TaxID=28197 RepID=UPI00264A4D82|nr:hypothetical protein [Aliarcobacter butzleri]
MIKIKNNELLYGYFIISFYFSLFIPYTKGFLDLYSINNTIKVGFLVIVQGFIYVLPVLFLFLINIKQKKLLLIPALYLYVIFTIPYTEFFDIKDFIYGWKNYLLIFLNLFILLHLMENYEDFQIKIEKHIKVIFFLSGFILFFEILSSWVFLNSFYIFLRKLAGIEPILFGKPNGISLNIHAQGFIFSLGFFYFFINKNYKIALVMFICLLFAIVKTWLLVFFVTFIVFTFKSIKLKFFYFTLFLLLISSFITILLFPDILSNYVTHFSPDSYPMQVIGGQLLNSLELLYNSILPNGLIYDLHSYKMPEIIYGSEIYFLQVLFQLGIVGFLLYMLILFSGVFNFNNKYWILSFLSLFTVLHTFALQFLYIFYIAMYFNHYYIIQKRSKYQSNSSK